MGFLLKISVMSFVAFFLFCLRSEGQTFLTLPMAIVVESQSSWLDTDIEEMTQKTNQILSQCRIEVRLDHLEVSPLSVIPMDYDSLPMAKKYYDELHKPLLFLVSSVQYNQSAGWAPGSKYLFISKYSRSSEYKQKRSALYEPLAHELGHLLGNLQHLNETHGSNLMAGYVTHLSDKITPEQCTKMRAHPKLVPMERYSANLEHHLVINN